MDLPLYKLAKILKDLVSRAVNESSKPDATKEKAASGNHKNKSRKRKKKSESREPSSVSADELITGVSTQQLRKAIRDIIDGTANLDELTVKGVRKRLEIQLGIDLSSHKSVVKKMVKEEL
jgi:formylmethanofuran:tetrahydromethanopterin formyltransferase